MVKRRFVLLAVPVLGLAVVVGLVSRQPVKVAHAAHESGKTAAGGHQVAFAEKANGGAAKGVGAVKVEVAKPKRGGLLRTTSQPGSVHAFESAELFAKVSGYLKIQNVDIGDRVKKDQVLAVIDAPELIREVEKEEATVAQSEAQLKQAQASLSTAIALHKASIAVVTQREAEVKRSIAMLDFRKKMYTRIKELAEDKAIDERLVDEKFQQQDSAEAAHDAAEAAVLTSRADVAAAEAKIKQAEADIVAAEAKIALSKASLAKAKVFEDYLTIRSPYDGVITLRAFHLGDFINEASLGAKQQPVLSVDRTDLMRIVVEVPDRDVPFVDRGDTTVISIDALPGMAFKFPVSRFANSEDPSTRTMRTEVDVPNPKNLLRNGMYGQVTILLQANGSAQDALVIPASCLVGDTINGKGHVFVVRQKKAQRVAVQVGADDGINIEVVTGVKFDDEVVCHPSASVDEGVTVSVESIAADPKADANVEPKREAKPEGKHSG